MIRAEGISESWWRLSPPQKNPLLLYVWETSYVKSRHDATAERRIGAQRTRTTDVGMSLYCLRLHDGEEK